MAGALPRIRNLPLARIRQLVSSRLGALVELETETAHELRRPRQVEAPGLEIGPQVGPGVLVQPPEGVAIARRVEDHVHEPHRLQRLPEGLGRPGRRLAQVGGHLA